MISVFINIFFKKLLLANKISWKIVTELLSVLLTFMLIYFASEAFSFKEINLSREKSNVFVFLLTGEIALLLPMSVSERIISIFVEIKNNQFYQTLIGVNISPIRYVAIKSITELVFPLLRVFLVLLISCFFFNLKVSIFSLFIFFLLQFFSIITFFIMALITILAYLRFKRGVSFFYTMQSVATILSGAYFPISALPKYLGNISKYLPQSQILDTSRQIFNGLSIASFPFLVLLLWSVVLGISYLYLDYALKRWLKIKARFI